MVRLNAILLTGRRRFIDSVRITAQGGRGGNGLPKYCGVGGKGGDVFAVVDEEYTLKDLKADFPKQKFIAGAGGDSRTFSVLGDAGEDVKIKCPPGVTVKSDSCILGELNEVGQQVLLAKGGCGGGPQNGYLGQKGQTLSLTLDLKLMADIGFVGYPNAGKSTLLKSLSNARPKIANYPFTTVSPNLGILDYPDFRKITAADLPGLIEGAHLNHGMGHKFLKHCIRTKILLFIVDITGFRLNPWSSHRSAFETIVYLNRELELFDKDLLDKPIILAVNKLDLDLQERKFNDLMDKVENYKINLQRIEEKFRPSVLVKFDSILPISAELGTNIEQLRNKIRAIIDIYEEEKLKKELEANSLMEMKSDVIYA